MGKKVKIKPVVVTVDPVIVADPVDVPAPPAPVVPVLPPLVLTPAWGFNFDVAAPAGLASVGNVELRIASGDGEVALFKLQQAPFGWLPSSGLEVAPQILPTQPDPANFLWVSQIGTLEDTDGYNANQTGGYLNLGSLGIEYAFGADYRNVGEHYDVDILLNGAVQAHQSIDVII